MNTQNLAKDAAQQTKDLIEQVLRTLSGRTYSPRIKLLNMRQVVEATGLSESTIRRLMDQKQFPLPQKNLGQNVWRESAIVAWADRNDPNQER